MRIFIIGLMVLNLACEKEAEDRYIVKLQLVPFEISGNGKYLNYPLWAKPVELDEIEKTVKTVDEMYNDLEKIYGQKHYSSWGVYYWSGVTSSKLLEAESQPTFANFLLSKYINEFDGEIMLTNINQNEAKLVFRVDRKGEVDEKGGILNGGIKYLPITLQNGKSVSVGSFFQDDGNKGVLFVLAMESMKLKSNTSEKEALQFFKTGKIQHNIKKPEEWTKSLLNLGMLSKSFSSNSILSDLRDKNHPDAKFIPYDGPPQPLTSISPSYPEEAQEAGIEGMVIIQAFVDEQGHVKETIVLKGIPNSGLDEAAIDAIKAVTFAPAKQKDEAVGVWISLPVNFKLK